MRANKSVIITAVTAEGRATESIEECFHDQEDVIFKASLTFLACHRIPPSTLVSLVSLPCIAHYHPPSSLCPSLSLSLSLSPSLPTSLPTSLPPSFSLYVGSADGLCLTESSLKLTFEHCKTVICGTNCTTRLLFITISLYYCCTRA